jgi:cytochrome c oxidase accessory protein FixG
LQSALVDRDSLVIGYDGQRGEPRGKAHARDRGACVDCNRCVAVCPTGIDIRNGLQMECIACAQCIDACDEIMDKLAQPRGLIRYDSQRGLEGGGARSSRARLWAYGGLALVALVALALSARGRAPFEASLVRAPGPPFVLDGGTIRNQLVLHLVNKRDRALALRIVTETAPAEVALPQRELVLEPQANLRVPLFVSLARARFAAPFAVVVSGEDAAGERARAEARFVGPPH